VSLETAPQIDQFRRGDTRGAALLVENVAISRGASQILTSINWRIEPKAKWGLVGSNGCGKSTLLKGILGQISLDEGSITVGTTQQVGYLPQSAVAGSNRTIFEEAASAMKKIEEARRALERAQTIVADGVTSDPLAALAALDRAMEQFQAVGGYTQEQQVETVLKGLGFKDMAKRCDELSGGWQMRVSLARLLLSQPTLCILDEPGNHLDVNAKNWLAGYLKTYTAGAMILVTHDVQLLNSVDHIAEIAMGQIQLYKSCNHDQYLQEREFRAQAAQAEYERNLEKAAKLQGFVDRFGASATKASAAQSRVKQIEKMREQGLLDAPADHLQNRRFLPRLRLPKPPKAIGENLLWLKGGQVGHSANLPLISDIDLRLVRGMKILLRGPNGCGKSTILHSLRGQLQLLQGQLISNDGLRLGVFTQDLAQELPATARAVDLVTAYGRTYDENLSDQDARTVMGALGLTGEKSLRQIRELSGGEKARVALAMFALKPSNLYLLDEVSNHLDIEW
jgi:ATPase subunit of ABC transporter with duplicated ATPase domains